MGLGPVGRAIARAALKNPELELVAAIEKNNALIGKPLSELIQDFSTDVTVTSDAKSTFAKIKGGVLLHATGSQLSRVAPQILSAVEAGVSVVSTCPELSYPWLHHRELAESLDRAGSKSGVSVLGTGVNPGFVLDRLVACAGAASGDIVHAQAIRVVDISNRRAALLRKAGVSLSPADFQSHVDAGLVGHLGLTESAALVGLGLGLDCDTFEEQIDPVIADEPWDGPVSIRPGQAAGYYHRARGLTSGTETVHLKLTYAVGRASEDAITIEAQPRIELLIRGGISGDLATSSSVVNAAPHVVCAKPGIVTVIDLPARR